MHTSCHPGAPEQSLPEARGGGAETAEHVKKSSCGARKNAYFLQTGAAEHVKKEKFNIRIAPEHVKMHTFRHPGSQNDVYSDNY